MAAGDRRTAAPELFARSLIIHPNSVMALTLAGWIEIMRGNQRAGGTMIERAQNVLILARRPARLVYFRRDGNRYDRR